MVVQRSRKVLPVLDIEGHVKTLNSHISAVQIQNASFNLSWCCNFHFLKEKAN